MIGALQWHATNCAPWLSASVSILSGKIKGACISDLLEANRLVRQAKSLCNIPLKFSSESPSSDLRLGVFADAAWANRHDGSSQGGRVIVRAPSRLWKGE